MKRVICLIVLTLAAGATGVYAQGTKIGVVDADDVIQRSSKGKAFFAEYQRFTKAKQDELKALFDAFKEKQKDLQARAASMSDDKKKEAGMELQRMQTDLKRKQEDAQRETNKKLQSKLDQFQKELAPLIRQVALEMKLDLVLNYGPQSNIVFIGDRVNITNAVIAKYDRM